jgi:hypothetical protein
MRCPSRLILPGSPAYRALSCADGLCWLEWSADERPPLKEKIPRDLLDRQADSCYEYGETESSVCVPQAPILPLASGGWFGG